MIDLGVRAQVPSDVDPHEFIFEKYGFKQVIDTKNDIGWRYMDEFRIYGNLLSKAIEEEHYVRLRD